MRRLSFWIVRLALLAALLWLAVAAGFAARAWSTHAALEAWHTVRLKDEFQANDAARIDTLEKYRANERALLDQVTQVMAQSTDARLPYARYTPNSPGARRALDPDGFNFTRLQVPAQPRGAVLLLHGLSDSPYSLRAVGETFKRADYAVLSLRLPGHGTLPSGLRFVAYEDWLAAVALGAKEAAAAAPGRPLILVGYSTGAPLALHHALAALNDPRLAKPTELVLISPALKLKRLAWTALFAANLSVLPGLEKAEWLDVYPELDPYKYGSFTINAARQIYRLDRALDAELSAANERGALKDLPPVTLFQSVVDATVDPRGALELLEALPERGARRDSLVLFDVNRQSRHAALLAADVRALAIEMREAGPFRFDVALISNRADTLEVAAYSRAAGATEIVERALDLRWPRSLVSLSHVALPFRTDDPLYGLEPVVAADGFTLGGPAPRGESSALALPLGNLARLRSNPFFAVIDERLQALTSSPPN
jgi:alpha-beta hydrolase superfamily lysophospholipase